MNNVNSLSGILPCTLTSAASSSSQTATTATTPDVSPAPPPVDVEVLEQRAAAIRTDDNFEGYNDKDLHDLLPFVTYTQKGQISQTVLEKIVFSRLTPLCLSALLHYLPMWRFVEISKEMLPKLTFSQLDNTRLAVLFAPYSPKEIEELLGDRAKEILNRITTQPPKGAKEMISQIPIVGSMMGSMMGGALDGSGSLLQVGQQIDSFFEYALQLPNLPSDFMESLEKTLTNPFLELAKNLSPSDPNLAAEWGKIAVSQEESMGLVGCMKMPDYPQGYNPFDSLQLKPPKEWDFSILPPETIRALFSSHQDLISKCSPTQQAAIRKVLTPNPLAKLAQTLLPQFPQLITTWSTITLTSNEQSYLQIPPAPDPDQEPSECLQTLDLNRFSQETLRAMFVNQPEPLIQTFSVEQQTLIRAALPPPSSSLESSPKPVDITSLAAIPPVSSSSKPMTEAAITSLVNEKMREIKPQLQQKLSQVEALECLACAFTKEPDIALSKEWSQINLAKHEIALIATTVFDTLLLATQNQPNQAEDNILHEFNFSTFRPALLCALFSSHKDLIQKCSTEQQAAINKALDSQTLPLLSKLARNYFPKFPHLIANWSTIDLTTNESSHLDLTLKDPSQTSLQQLDFYQFTDETLQALFADAPPELMNTLSDKQREKIRPQDNLRLQAKQTFLSEALAQHFFPLKRTLLSLKRTLFSPVPPCDAFVDPTVSQKDVNLLNTYMLPCYQSPLVSATSLIRGILGKERTDKMLESAYQSIDQGNALQCLSLLNKMYQGQEPTLDDMKPTMQMSFKIMQQLKEMFKAQFQRHEWILLFQVIAGLPHHDVSGANSPSLWDEAKALFEKLTNQKLETIPSLSFLKDCASNLDDADLTSYKRAVIDMTYSYKITSPKMLQRSFSLESCSSEVPSPEALAQLLFKEKVLGLNLRKPSSRQLQADYLEKLFTHLTLKDHPLLAINIEGFTLTNSFVTEILNPYILYTCRITPVIHYSSKMLEEPLSNECYPFAHGKLPEERKDLIASF